MSIGRRTFSRRQAIGGAAALGAASATIRIGSPRAARAAGTKRKLMILGIDGAEPSLIRRYVDEGILPTFKKLIENGKFGTLQTTLPPQSPVAWSSFISGTKPGGHGIFDFIHRDPRTMIPYLSTSKSEGSSSRISLGSWSLPVSSGTVSMMRRGPVVWDHLEEHGIPATVFAIPSNFPTLPTGKHVRTTSGMGTPDLLGSYGTFTVISERPVPGSSEFTGGRAVRVVMRDNQGVAKLEGPPNDFRTSREATALDVKLTRDPNRDAVMIEVDGQSLILERGEWSGWIPLRFSLVSGLYSVPGMVRFYVKSVHPFLSIYISPINVDPLDPTLPICAPGDFTRELAENAGRFYTQGFPADQKALSHGVLSDEEYFQQAKIVLDENFALLDYLLPRFDDGLFFFYFSSIDQNCHMLWRCCDPSHPQYDPKASEEIRSSVRYFYERIDEALAKAMARVDNDTTLMILSDHGFSTFTREFHLNTWLADQGYTRLNAPIEDGPGDVFSLVDWDSSEAYGLGFNGLYLNRKDREPHGHVEAKRAEELKKEIAAKLLEYRDPDTGETVVVKAHDGAIEYKGPHSALAPDLVLGFRPGYRTSDDSVLGKFPVEMSGPRESKWAADHCFEPSLVPGILISNRNFTRTDAGIWDFAPTILTHFGITPPPEMEGRDIFASA